MSRRGYKSSEKVEFSSSEDESPALPTLIERSPSPSSSVSSSFGPSSSPAPSSSKSLTRTPTPDPSSYHYIPPGTHELSTSKEKPALPNLRTNEELYLLRIPKGVELKDIQFNFRKRKARIGEEEWKLLDENTGDTRIIKPMENSEKFEFSIETFARGLNVVRDVQVPPNNEKVRGETLEKKRKSDAAEVEHEKRRKQNEKDHKHNEDKQKEKHKTKEKEKHHDKEKHRSKEKSKDKEKHTHGGKEGKQKSEKHKHRHS